MLIIFCRTKIEKIPCSVFVKNNQGGSPRPLREIGELTPFAASFMVTAVRVKITPMVTKLKKEILGFLTFLNDNTLLIGLCLKDAFFKTMICVMDLFHCFENAN